MLLEDIMGGKVKQEFKTSKEWFKELDDFENEASTALGTGYYSSVINSDVIGEVTKILYGVGGSGYGSIDEIRQDPYVQFILEIAENNVSDGNPFLPRLGMIEVIVGRDENYYLKIHMEKLHPFKNLSRKEIEAIARIVSGNSKDFDLMEKAFRMMNKDTSVLLYQLTLFPIWAASNKGLKKVKGVINKMSISDPKLVNIILDISESISDGRLTVTNNEVMEAIRLINDIQKGGDYNYDLHYSNVMVRRTSVGPQLVIIDPLAT